MSLISKQLRSFLRKPSASEDFSSDGSNPIDLAFSLVDRSPMKILQIGASDGGLNDPIAHYLNQNQHDAILVEPLPESFKTLQKRYEACSRVKCLNVAIGNQSGEQTLYTISKDCPYEAKQLSSFSKEHLRKNGVKERHIRAITVPTFSLPDLVESENFQSIDLLQVDTEGFDAEIVEMALKLASPPRWINFEHLHIPKPRRVRLCALLKKAGYRWIHSSWDTFAWSDSPEMRT